MSEYIVQVVISSQGTYSVQANDFETALTKAFNEAVKDNPDADSITIDLDHTYEVPERKE